MGGRQHRTGVSMTHSKLAFGSASQRGVHEVTSLKPARWVVMEPSKQFLHGLSFVGFLILTVNLSQVGYFFFSAVLVKVEMIADNFYPKASRGHRVQIRWLVAGTAHRGS